MTLCKPWFLLVAVLLSSYWDFAKAHAADPAAGMLVIHQAGTDKGDYRAGETVSLSFSLQDLSEHPRQIKELVLEIRDLSNRALPAVFTKTIATDLVLPAKNGHQIKLDNFYRIPAGIQGTRACGVFLDCRLDNQEHRRLAISFFRVADDKTRLTYDIRRSQYQGLEIFELTGGMSAEYAVQKSLAALIGGIAHSWHGRQGPEPVLSTPDFLQQSVRQTVGLYNQVIGAKTKVKTVIIGPGVPSVPYLATTMSAVYLPSHFLVSANSALEIQSILNHSIQAGNPAYAVFGYDGSMPAVGVAWIKLLDLPAEYKEFIVDHQVEEVILCGVGEKAPGETCARKVMAGKTAPDTGAGSLYILYTHYGSDRDKQELADRIYDLDALALGENQQIADWESGIPQRQIASFAASIKATTQAKPYSLTTTGDMISLYDLAGGLVVKCLKKNEAVLKPPFIKGVVMNEYLVSHPQYEMYSGQVPLLYWQFVSAKATVDRCFGSLKRTVAAEYPEIGADWSRQGYFLNSNYGREALKNELTAKGVDPARITIRNQGGDIWNPVNGMNAPCEKFAETIIKEIGIANYQAKVKALKPLTIPEVQSVCEKIGGLKFVAQ